MKRRVIGRMIGWGKRLWQWFLAHDFWVLWGLIAGWWSFRLNYNSPFADEAIYVVIGKLGVFDWDWWTYNASSWLGGSPYAFPLISALTYTLGGIVASRMMSVIFGLMSLECVYWITRLLLGDTRRGHRAGMMAVFLVGLAPVSYYLARLATYDMPAFYFLLLSLLFLIRVEFERNEVGKNYFLAAISLFVAMMIKLIVVLFVPIFLWYSYVRARTITKRKHRFFWKRYYLSILILACGIYTLVHIKPMLTYTGVQLSRDRVSIETLVKQISTSLWYLVPVGGLGVVYLWLRGKRASLGVLILSIVAVFGFHLLLGRAATLDKHLYVPGVFGSILAGVGLAYLLELRWRWFSFRWVMSSIVLSLGGLGLYLIPQAETYNHRWQNTTQLLTYLSGNVRSDDIVLTEEGPPVLLSLYQIQYPPTVTTYDWFEYRKLTQVEAYRQAIRDGYFSVIEVSNDAADLGAEKLEVHEAVRESLDQAYELSYDDGHYQVYRRVYN